MKRKTLVFIVILMLIGFLIFQIIKYATHSYDFLNASLSNFEAVLNDQLMDDFSVTSAFSNGQDTMVNLRFQDYGIVIWSIQNLQETTTKGVYLNRIKNRNFYFTSYTKQEVSPILEINYKLPDHPIKEMVINFSKETIISDTVRTVMNQGYYFKTRKLGISEPDKRSMIIFDFNKTTESAIFNVATSSRRYLTLIYKLNDGRFDIEIAKKILK